MKTYKRYPRNGLRNQVIHMESEQLDVDYVPVEDWEEIQAMERGENGWQEAKITGQRLVRCMSPIRGTVYNMRLFGSALDAYFPKAVVLCVLGGQKGRLFLDAKGTMRVVLDLPRDDLEILLALITAEAYRLAGIIS